MAPINLKNMSLRIQNLRIQSMSRSAQRIMRYKLSTSYYFLGTGVQRKRKRSKLWKIIGGDTLEDLLFMSSRGANIVVLKVYGEGEGEQELEKMRP